jgi:hypothetical protein
MLFWALLAAGQITQRFDAIAADRPDSIHLSGLKLSWPAEPKFSYELCATMSCSWSMTAVMCGQSPGGGDVKRNHIVDKPYRPETSS